MSRSIRPTVRSIARPIAVAAALTLALSGLAVIAPASGAPLAASESDAAPVSPAAAPVVSGILEYRLPDSSTAPVVDGLIRFWREVSPGSFEVTNEIVNFGPNGEFTASPLAGTYRIEFITFDVASGARTYWNNEAVFFAADEVALNDDMTNPLGTVIIEPQTLSFTRIAGLDRFATAAALTAELFDGTSRAPVVYIVNAFGFADALSAGPAAAAQGGVLLPVRAASIPDVIHDELTRLDPERIVIAGGVGVVSEAVEAQLQNYVDAPGDVERVAGPDRYATSRAIVIDAFGASGLNDLYFATGRDFPDALAAGPAASNVGGAVLLVDGVATTLPLATRTLINDFGEPNAFLAGGTGVISSTIAEAIAAEVGGTEFVTRLAGADRFGTARAINDHAFGQSEAYSDFAFIANAFTFPDALSAGPVAAAFQAPLYLSAKTCLKAQAYSDLAGLLVSQAFVVGGTGVLSDRVLGGSAC